MQVLSPFRAKKHLIQAREAFLQVRIMLTATTTPQVDLGAFKVIVARDEKTVSLPGATADSPLTCQAMDFLKAAVMFLSSDTVKNSFPHAALPFEPWPVLMRPYIASELERLGESYSNRFGEPDHLGRQSIFTSPRHKYGTMQWGAGAAELTIDSTKQTISLKTLSFISTELFVDILVCLLADPYTAKHFPDFSAPYLRRWGEDAFEVTALKTGVPRHLDGSTTLSRTSMRKASDAPEPVRELEAPKIASKKPSLEPTPPSSTVPSAIAPEDSFLSQVVRMSATDLTRRENDVTASEERLAQRASELLAWQEKLTGEQLTIDTRISEAERAEENARSWKEIAETTLARAKETLARVQEERHLNQNERQRNEAILAGISSLLQNRFIDTNNQ